MSEKFEHTIDTPKGSIKVEGFPDGDYPGVYISVNGVQLVLVEFDKDEDKHAIRVWSHKDPDNDWVYKQEVPNVSPKQEEEEE